jgi:hypothetical protein
MRSVTKVIKDILKATYPACKISVRFHPARQYVDGSDKLFVFVRGATYSEVCATLTSCTRGIKIFPKGAVASCGGLCRPEALDIATHTWVDFDMCEFLELEVIE